MAAHAHQPAYPSGGHLIRQSGAERLVAGQTTIRRRQNLGAGRLPEAPARMLAMQ